MAPSQRKLSKADIEAIAEIVHRREDEEKRESWIRDKRKRKRVALVAVMIAVALGLEHFLKLSWSHRLFEIGTDCIADFLLFGSIE